MERSIRPPTNFPLPSAHITLTEFSQWWEALIIIIITTLLLHPAVFALASLANRGDLNAQAWIIQSHVGGFYQNPPPKKRRVVVIKSISGAHQTNLSTPRPKLPSCRSSDLIKLDKAPLDPSSSSILMRIAASSSGLFISDGEGKVVGREAPKNIFLGVSKKDDLYWFWVF